jgi:thermostable 8-oxoguanine DNA glycosylase
MRAYELEESAVEELKDRLPKLKLHNYDTIDRLMQNISIKHKITGKKLHDMFVSKYGHTPDTWVKKITNRLGEEGLAEDSTAHDCKHCNGKGYHSVTKKDGTKVATNCPQCKGKGYIVTKGVAEGSLEEVDRRGFLKGMGAAAVAGAAGGSMTKANAQEVTQWVRYATELSINTFKRFARGQDTGYDLRNWLVVNVSNWVTDYCAKTNSYNAKAVIDYCNQQAIEATGLEKQSRLVTGLLTNMKNRYQDYLSAYRAGIQEAFQKFNVAVQSQQHEKNVMGTLGKEEFDTLLDALIIYAICKDRQLENSDAFKAISASIKRFIDANNAKDYVNNIYPKAKQSVEMLKNNPDVYQKEASHFFKNAGNTIAKLDNISSNKKPEFESVEQGVAEEWSKKYKDSINCSNPKGFSQKAHCAGKKKHDESIAEVTKQSAIKQYTDVQNYKPNYKTKPKSDTEEFLKITVDNPNQKKSKVSEGVEGPEDIQKIKDFIKWSYKTLNMQKPYPKITISKNTEVAQAGHHTGVHKGNNIWVYVGNRNMIDIFRTIFHELTHHRQMQLNMIKDGDSYPGSPIEMLADMAAGKYIKIYGKDHPEMFQ